MSALACAAIQDVLLRTNGINVQDDAAMKGMLYRIVAMVTRMAMKFDGVAESDAEVHAEIDYDYEHRFAEHEHDDADEPGRSSLHNVYVKRFGQRFGKAERWARLPAILLRQRIR